MESPDKKKRKYEACDCTTDMYGLVRSLAGSAVSFLLLLNPVLAQQYYHFHGAD